MGVGYFECVAEIKIKQSFNRGGDSWGWATISGTISGTQSAVSIAGAILGGGLHSTLYDTTPEEFVSIAGAILGGGLLRAGKGEK